MVGGGVAGMTSALSLANQGYEVYLVEKETDLGGMAQKNSLHPGRARCSGIPERSHTQGLSAPSAPCHDDATITDVAGYVGNFVTKVKSGSMDKGDSPRCSDHRHRRRRV